MKAFFTLGLMSLLFILKQAAAQNTEQWNFVLNGAGDGTEELFGMTVDTFGNTILIATTDTGFLDYATVIIKLNPQGNKVWMSAPNLNGPVGEPVAVLTDDSGNIYVAGSYDSPGNLSSDIYLVKLDTAGNQLWASYFSSQGNIIDAARGMLWDNAGNLIVIGETGATVSTTDALVVKYDTAGIQLWQSVYSNPVNKQDQVEAAAVDAENNIYVCGNVYVDTSRYRDFQVFKMDSSGTVEWARTYNDSMNYGDQCTAIIVDNNGDIIVTGESTGWGPGYPVNEIATIKYDATGNVQWITRYETSTSTAIPSGIAVDENDNIYIVGSAYDGTTKFDCITIKYNASGNEQWVRLIQGTQVDADGGSDILYDEGKIYVAGYVANNSTYDDALVAAYDVSGNLLYREEWNSAQNDEDDFSYIAKDEDGNLIAAGIVEKFNDDDLLVVKFSVANVSINEPEAATFTVYPNPTSGELNLQGLQFEAGADIGIFNLLGKEVYFTQFSHTASNIKIQTANMEDGMYLLRVKSGGYYQTKPVIVQRKN